MAAEKKHIDVAKHILVPKHVKLSEEEGEKVLEKFNIKRKQLPRIKASDPAIRGLEAKGGDIIRIERDSPTCGKRDFYRVVISV